jgi:hypothetical protein
MGNCAGSAAPSQVHQPERKESPGNKALDKKFSELTETPEDCVNSPRTPLEVRRTQSAPSKIYAHDRAIETIHEGDDDREKQRRVSGSAVWRPEPSSPSTTATSAPMSDVISKLKHPFDDNLSTAASADEQYEMLWVQRPVQRAEDNAQPGRVHTSNVRRSMSTPERDPKMIWDTIRAENLGRYNNASGESLATERLNRWRERSNDEKSTSHDKLCSGRVPILRGCERDAKGETTIIYRI